MLPLRTTKLAGILSLGQAIVDIYDSEKLRALISALNSVTLDTIIAYKLSP
ncbi:MAG: hypothetical protein ACJA0N_001397 [Pseudohongiellaceae bacterium]|jgi:hypothetical protein